jgi:tRNA U38,U39,U40 pseudouridine synthase TruA
MRGAAGENVEPRVRRSDSKKKCDRQNATCEKRQREEKEESESPNITSARANGLLFQQPRESGQREHEEEEDEEERQPDWISHEK